MAASAILVAIAFALMPAFLLAAEPAAPKPATPPPVETVTVDAYNKLKAERDTAQQQAAQIAVYQQRVEYLGVLSERNEYAFRLASVDLAAAQQKIDALQKELAAAKAPPPPPPVTSSKPETETSKK